MHSHGEMMTAQERMDALYKYEKPDRVPNGLQLWSLGFNTVNLGFSITEAYGDPAKSFESFLKTSEKFGWNRMLQCFRHSVLAAQDFGGEVRLPEGDYESGLVILVHPVRSEKDLDKLQMPDPKNAGGIPTALRFAELQAEYGIPVTFLSRSPFSMAANICGIERFLVWTIEKPEVCELLMQMALDHSCNVLGDWVERFGAEKLFVWMSSPLESNQLISPRTFETHVLPYYMTYKDRLESLGIKRFGIHLCGDHNLNLPHLAEALPWTHPSVISIGSEVDIEVAGDYFAEDIIYGNIDPSVIQTGTPQQLYELCKAVIEKGKKVPGDFILGTGCELPVKSPQENLHAITEAVVDFGWYN